MSILSNKKKVFEQIGILKTASELSLNDIKNKNDIFSAFESSKIKNNKDPYLLMVDLLTVLSGSNASKDIITHSFSIVDKLEKSFKSNLKNELTSTIGGVNSASPIPSVVTNGVKIHINKIDYFKELFISDTSAAHDLYLDDYKKSLISIVKTPNVTKDINSVISGSYDNSSGFLTIKPLNSNQSFNDFLSSLVDNTNFVNSKVLLNQTLDAVFNTQKKSVSQILIEAQIDKVLDKLITQIEEDDSYFTFDTQEIIDLEKKSVLSDQFYTNTGVSLSGVTLDLNDLSNINSGITASISKKVINKVLDNVITNATSNTTLSSEDKQAVNNNFLTRIMLALKTNLIRNFVVSPQINIIYQLSESFKANSDNLYDPIEDIKNRKSIINCMVKKLMNDLLANLFSLIKKELLAVLGSVALLYAQEGYDKYKKILKSLYKNI